MPSLTITFNYIYWPNLPSHLSLPLPDVEKVGELGERYNCVEGAMAEPMLRKFEDYLLLLGRGGGAKKKNRISKAKYMNINEIARD